MQLLLRRGADLARGDLAVLEQHQSRDRHDAVFGRGVRVLVDVQLDDLDLVAELAGDLFQSRRDHAARPAPFRPEVHDDRLGGFQDVRFETCVRRFADGHGNYLLWIGGGESPSGVVRAGTYERVSAASRRYRAEVI